MVEPIELTIRPCRESERRAAAALVGGDVIRPDAWCYCALPTGSSHVIGAAAVLQQPLSSRPPSLPVHLGVARPFRRRGVARAMIRFLDTELLERAGKAVMCSWFGVERSSETGIICERVGFVRRPKLSHYNADVATYLNLMNLTVDRMQRSGRLPPEALSIPLDQAHRGEIIEMHRRFIGGFPARLERRILGEGVRPFDNELSRVAVLKGRLCGFVLSRVNHENKLVIDARVVLPEYRRGWVNPLLLRDCGEIAMRRGVRITRFLAGDTHQDTHRIATRFGSAAVRIMDVYLREPGRS